MADVTPSRPPGAMLNGRSDEQKARERADELLLPFEPLDAPPADSELWGAVPLELLVRYSCVPVGFEGERIVLAFGPLQELTQVDELEFLLERPIEAVVAPAERVATLLKRHRGGEVLLEQASEGLRLQFVDDDEEDVDLKTLPAESPIVRLVDSLVLGAIDRRASDIHVETKDREVLAKYRIDGVLYPAMEPIDKQFHSMVLSRIKIMSELDISEKRVPQDGRFKLKLKGRAIDFRVNTLPTLFGEKIVLRILDPSSAQMGIDALGYEEDQKEMYLKVLNQPQGMILVTGPTGSGKSTTLQCILKDLRSERINITTVEAHDILRDLIDTLVTELTPCRHSTLASVDESGLDFFR